MLVFPLLAALYVHFFLRSTVSYTESVISFLFVAGVSLLLITATTYRDLGDVEVVNGQVLSKERNHGSYIRPYTCNCRTISTGKTSTTVCSTCFETRHTVEWLAKTSVGVVTFDKKDSGSSSVYNSPDPAAYTECYTGQPVSLQRAWANYIKAEPESLFNTKLDTQMYSESVPAYPKVHSFYKINRVLDVNSGLPQSTITSLNDSFNHALKELGPSKQVNIITILTSINDPYYKHAVENQWVGAKNNDVVLLFGVDGNNILWSDAFTWGLNTDNEMFVASLKSKLSSMKTFEVQEVVTQTTDTISSLYNRPSREKFRYLFDSLTPPVWVVAICWLLSLLGTVVLTYIFHKHVDIK
jgi:hypothetical protein